MDDRRVDQQVLHSSGGFEFIPVRCGSSHSFDMVGNL